MVIYGAAATAVPSHGDFIAEDARQAIVIAWRIARSRMALLPGHTDGHRESGGAAKELTMI